MTAREKAIRAHRALLNNSGKLAYFEERGISAETVRAAWVGYEVISGSLTYPCIAGAVSGCSAPSTFSWISNACFRSV